MLPGRRGAVTASLFQCHASRRPTQQIQQPDLGGLDVQIISGRGRGLGRSDPYDLGRCLVCSQLGPLRMNGCAEGVIVGSKAVLMALILMFVERMDVQPSADGRS